MTTEPSLPETTRDSKDVIIEVLNRLSPGSAAHRKAAAVDTLIALLIKEREISKNITKLVDAHIRYTDAQEWAKADRTRQMLAQLTQLKEEGK